METISTCANCGGTVDTGKVPSAIEPDLMRQIVSLKAINREANARLHEARVEAARLKQAVRGYFMAVEADADDYSLAVHGRAWDWLKEIAGPMAAPD